jgi:ATP:ADP antiporter, AAA family
MRGVLDVRPGERATTFGAFAALFAITGGHTLLETARDALFLAKLPPERLPWMYLAIAVVGLAIARLGKRASGAATASLAAAIAITSGFWLLSTETSEAFVYALFIWTGTVGSWMVLQFWLLLGGVMHVGQAKRLFGFVGAGGVLGATAGAATARAVAGAMETRHLLVAASILFATAILPSRMLEGRAGRAAANDSRATAQTGSLFDEVERAAKDPYVVRIASLVLVAAVALTLVDYVFKAVVAAAVPKEALGTTFATIYTILNAIALVVQLGLVSSALRVLGVHRALAILPALVLLGGGGVVILGTFAAAVVLKGFDGVLRHSMHKTTTELLYLPLAEEVRTRAKPLVDLFAQRGGQAAASVGLLIAASFGARPQTIAVFVIALAGVWLVFAARIGKPYLDAFRAGLARGRIDPDLDLPQLDLGALEALFAALNSPRDAEVLGALDLLAAQRRHRLIPALILYHPSPSVVLRALDLLVEEGRDDFLPITERLLDHQDAGVRAAAVRARAKVAPDLGALRAHLEDERPEVRATALVALMSRGDPADAQNGGSALEGALADPSAAVRAAVVKAMSADPHPSFAPVLVEALDREKDREVRIELAGAIGKVGSSGAALEPLVDALAPLLPQRGVGPAARSALAELASERVDLLGKLLDRAGDPVAWAVPRVLELCPANLAAPVLMRGATASTDGIVRFRSLKALTRLRRETPNLVLDREALETLAVSTIKHALELVTARVGLVDGHREAADRATPSGRLLEVLLKDKLSYAIGRLFLVLGLIYPRESFERIHRGITSADAKTRASSRELLEAVVEPPLRGSVLLLVDDFDDAERVARAADLAPPKPESYVALVASLAERDGELAALARHHAAELGLAASRAAPEIASASAFAKRVRATPSPYAEPPHG